jgi:hypothetical protein
MSKGHFEADSDRKRKNDQVLRAERQCFYPPPANSNRLFNVLQPTLSSAFSSGKQRLRVGEFSQSFFNRPTNTTSTSVSKDPIYCEDAIYRAHSIFAQEVTAMLEINILTLLREVLINDWISISSCPYNLKDRLKNAY